jgi:predicted acetyltransferase
MIEPPAYKLRLMNFTLLPASTAYKAVIQNLMQFYIYDFSEFIQYDVLDNGQFAPYPHLDTYWEDVDNKFPYIIKKDEKHVGFVLVKSIETENKKYFSIAEFFVLKAYRHLGVGKSIAMKVFNLHQGNWEVYQKESNEPAQIFWRKVIAAYTHGRYTERKEDGKIIQDFDSLDT